MEISPIGALCIAGAGAIGLGVSAFAFVSTQRFRRSAVRADGTVVELVESRSASSGDFGSGRFYYPRFQFRTQDGQQIAIKSDIGNSPAAFEVGEKVVVLYDPNKPVDAQIDTVSQFWMMHVAVGVLSVAVLVLGAWLYDSARN